MLKFTKAVKFSLPFGLMIAALVHAHEIMPFKNGAAPDTPVSWQEIIQKSITYYNEAYPEIRFLQLAGNATWYQDLAQVLNILGTDPLAFDYQHPLEVRETLLEVTLKRLKLMLKTNTVSATLFRVGHDSVLRKKYLCVITISPSLFGVSGSQAMKNMLNLPNETLNKISSSRNLDSLQYLEFVLNHEIFHCIDSHLQGGVPIAKKNVSAEFELFRRESMADAFAMAKHLQVHRDLTSFALNFLHLRALWPYSSTSHHCTFKTVRAILNSRSVFTTPMQNRALINNVLKVAGKAIGKHDEFVINHAAMLSAAKEIGINVVQLETNQEKLTGLQTNPELVRLYVKHFQYYYAMLFNDDEILLDIPE